MASRVAFVVLIREAVRNLVANRFLTVAIGAITLLTAFGVSTFAVVETSHIEQRWLAGIESGRFIWSVPPKAVGAVTAEKCDALNEVQGVAAAGALISTSKFTPRNDPKAQYSLDTVTTGYLKILWPGQSDLAASSGLVAGEEAARRLGLVRGGLLTLSVIGEGPTRWTTASIGAVAANSSPRDEAAGNHIYQVVPPLGAAVTCLVEAQPGADRGVQQLLFSWFPQDGEPVVRPYLEVGALSGQLPEVEYQHRVSRWGWSVASAVIALTVLGAWYARREELALYRLLGLSRPQLVIVLLIELAIGVIVPIQIGFTLSELLSLGDLRTFHAARFALVTTNVRLISSLLLLPILALVLVRPTRLLNRLKGE